MTPSAQFPPAPKVLVHPVPPPYGFSSTQSIRPPSISILGTLTYEHIETGRPDLEPSDNRRKRLDKRGARLQLVDAEAHEEDKSDGARVSHHELLTP